MVSVPVRHSCKSLRANGTSLGDEPLSRDCLAVRGKSCAASGRDRTRPKNVSYSGRNRRNLADPSRFRAIAGQFRRAAEFCHGLLALDVVAARSPGSDGCRVTGCVPPSWLPSTGVIGYPSSRNLGIPRGATSKRLSRGSFLTSSLSSISSRPRAFKPWSVRSSTRLAPQKSSFRDCSTIARSPVSSSSLLKTAQFCASLTRRHHRMTLTRTRFQSPRDSCRYGLPLILAVMGLRCAMINRCTSGKCGKRQAW